jgi:hypothetical protein
VKIRFSKHGYEKVKNHWMILQKHRKYEMICCQNIYMCFEMFDYVSVRNIGTGTVIFAIDVYSKAIKLKLFRVIELKLNF